MELLRAERQDRITGLTHILGRVNFDIFGTHILRRYRYNHAFDNDLLGKNPHNLVIGMPILIWTYLRMTLCNGVYNM